MNNSETKFTDLPYEVISYILNFITYTDKKCLRLVCKHFYLAATLKVDIKSESFIIKDSSAQKVIKILTESTREFFSFVFLKVDFTDDLMTIFDKYNKILNLNLFECNIDEKDLTKILLKCNNLQNLSISSCKSLFMPGVLFSNSSQIFSKGCPNLKLVTFNSCSYLSDNLLERFIRVFPNLESLSFNGTAISFHSGLCKRFYTENYTIENPATSVLTIIYICNILESIASKIKQLDFSNTNIDGESLEKVCTVKNLNLQSLLIANCKEIRKSFDLKLGYWQPNLVELNLSYCRAVNNESLRNICENIPQLGNLNIECCKNIDNYGLEHLRNLKKLTILNISDCGITSNNIQYALENCFLEEFRCQNMEFKENYVDAPIFLNNVTYLDFSYSNITDTCLNIIFHNCQKIKTLILFRCKSVTNYSLSGYTCFLKKINHINLDFCNITDALLCSYFDFPDLRQCSLNSTKVSYAGIKALVLGHNQLEVLCLNECDIDNECIAMIVTLKRLHTLSLINCHKLGNISAELITDHCEFLKELNITRCRNITLEGILKLSKMPSLQKFHHSLYSMSENGQFINFPPPPCLPLL